MLPHQPQHPFAAHPHPVLAAQPDMDLAVALAGERAVVEHLADQGEQLLVIDRPGRARPSQRDHVVAARSGAAGVDGRARCAEHRAHRRERGGELHGYRGRFFGGILQPPSFGGSSQDLVLEGVLADLAFGLFLSRRSVASPAPVGPRGLQPLAAVLEEVITPGGQPVRLRPRARGRADPAARRAAAAGPRPTSCSPTSRAWTGEDHRASRLLVLVYDGHRRHLPVRCPPEPGAVDGEGPHCPDAPPRAGRRARTVIVVGARVRGAAHNARPCHRYGAAGAVGQSGSACRKVTVRWVMRRTLARAR
jgi:hypothetical protein